MKNRSECFTCVQQPMINEYCPSAASLVLNVLKFAKLMEVLYAQTTQMELYLTSIEMYSLTFIPKTLQLTVCYHQH